MTSRSDCIERKCKECIYDSSEKGTWRQQVQHCTSYDCPLFGVRPLPIVVNWQKRTQLSTNSDDLEDETRLPHAYPKIRSICGIFSLEVKK